MLLSKAYDFLWSMKPKNNNVKTFAWSNLLEVIVGLFTRYKNFNIIFNKFLECGMMLYFIGLIITNSSFLSKVSDVCNRDRFPKEKRQVRLYTLLNYVTQLCAELRKRITHVHCTRSIRALNTRAQRTHVRIRFILYNLRAVCATPLMHARAIARIDCAAVLVACYVLCARARLQ